MGQLIIPSEAVIYADNSVFIYTIEANPDYYTLLQPLWQEFQAGNIELITSELTLMETLVVPIRDCNNDLVNTYEQFLRSQPLQLIPISQALLQRERAAQLRAKTRLKTPDAIHAATALNRNCTLFLTNDRAFRNIVDLPVVLLDEVTEE